MCVTGEGKVDQSREGRAGGDQVARPTRWGDGRRVANRRVLLDSFSAIESIFNVSQKGTCRVRVLVAIDGG